MVLEALGFDGLERARADREQDLGALDALRVQRSQELAAEMGWKRGVILNEVYMAYISASQGQDDVARILEATEKARAMGDAEITTAGSWLAGRFLAETGDAEAARNQLGRALEDAQKWELAPMVAVIEETVAAIGP